MYSCVWESTRKKVFRKMLAEFQQKQPDCQGPARAGVFLQEVAKQNCWGGTKKSQSPSPRHWELCGNEDTDLWWSQPGALTAEQGCGQLESGSAEASLGQGATAPGGWHGNLCCRKCGESPKGLGKSRQKWGCPQGPEIVMQRSNISTKKVVHISGPAID